MKKKDKNIVYGKANYNQDIVKMVKIFIVVVVILAIIYFLTAWLTGEIKFGKDEQTKKEVAIQYEEIIAGQIMNRNDENYYVMLFDFTDENAGTLISLKDNYTSVEEALPVYIVDLEKGFNDCLELGENETIIDNPTSINELKVNDTTILKIENGKVTNRVTTYDKVKEYIESISAR